MPSFFDFELGKALFHAVGEADFGVLAWPLSVLMVLRSYQSYVTYGLSALIVIAFFIGQLYYAQIEHSVAVVHAFAIRLQMAARNSIQSLLASQRIPIASRRDPLSNEASIII